MTKSRNGSGDKPPIPEASVSRFFESVEQRAWTDAEKELDIIRQKAENTQWSRGYAKALEGLVLTYKSNDDKYLFLPKVLSNRSTDSLQSLYKELAEFSSSEIHGEYDRGFFKALEDYVSALKNLQDKPKPSEQQTLVASSVDQDAQAEKPEVSSERTE